MVNLRNSNFTKQNIRKQYIALRNAISDERRKIAAQKAARNFINNFTLKNEDIIAAYYPIGSELDIRPLIKILRKKNLRLCLPTVVKKDNALIFRHWKEGAKLTKDLYNIPTPDENSEQLEPNIIITPLIAFDKNGNRLGYGKGYYDRTIANMQKRALIIGYAYAMQEVENIKYQQHDKGLDYLVSEKEVRRFNANIIFG